MSWQTASLALLGAVLAVGFLWYERRRPPAKVLSLVAALAALAVVGRLAFAAIPNVKPTTDIVLFAGYALGPVPGFAVGALTALASNVFLSQGPWTPWQMTGWAAVGVAGALLAKAARGRELGRLPLALACGLAGLGFGAFMDVYQWTLAARHDLPSYLAVSASSLPYNLAHALGNVGFSLIVGPAFLRSLRRYRRRFEVRWEPSGPAPAVLGAALAAVGVAAALAASAPPADGAVAASRASSAAKRASPSARAARYLVGAQNRDGGFGAAPGQASSQLYTGWAALGLAAARRNPRDVHRRGGRAITTYVRRRAGSLRDTGDLERTILVLRAAGLPPRRFAGRDLVRELLGRRRSDGSWSGTVNLTAFGILSLRAAGAGSLDAPARYLERSQNEDGGFGYTARARSDVDDTGAALQALAAAGRSGGAAVRRAVSYLRAVQERDGGFGQMRDRGSNAQSTAWAVQGLVAVRAGGESVTRGAAYLRRLQRRDGSVRYSGASGQTPVWVTAQALAALSRKPFPLGTVPRRRRGGRAVAGAAVHQAALVGSVKRRGHRAIPGVHRRSSAPRARISRDPSLRRAGTEAAQGRKRPKRRPTPLIAAAGVGALVVAGLFRWLMRSRRHSRHREEA